MDVLGAAPATSVTLEIEFGLQLAGHDQPGASGFTDIRFGNSLAEAHIHSGLLTTIMRSIISICLAWSSVNPPGEVDKKPDVERMAGENYQMIQVVIRIFYPMIA